MPSRKEMTVALPPMSGSALLYARIGPVHCLPGAFPCAQEEQAPGLLPWV